MSGERMLILKVRIALILSILIQKTLTITFTTPDPSVKKNVVYACGEVTHVLGNKITNGDRADPEEWPWMVALRRNATSENSYCGGTIVSDRHVITAAHCVDVDMNKYPLADIRLIMGEIEFSKLDEASPNIYRVESVDIHDEWNPTIVKNDIAILKTDRPIKMSNAVHPICLPTDSKTYVNEVATVIGFGATNQNAPTSNILLEVSLTILDNAECAQDYLQAREKDNIKYNHRFRIVETMICAGGTDGKDSCQGDSGGPLNCFNYLTKRWELCGIVSTGIGCGINGIPGIYTRVTSYHDWIVNIVGSGVESTTNKGFQGEEFACFQGHSDEARLPLPLPEYKKSCTTQCTQGSADATRNGQGPFGGEGGGAFTDEAASANGPITSVTIYSGRYVDGIQVMYGDVLADFHGTTNGINPFNGYVRDHSGGSNHTTLTLDSGERIVGFTVYYGQFFNGLAFTTSNGRTVQAGLGTGTFFHNDCPSCTLAFLGGRSGTIIDNLVLHWTGCSK